jgi:hypothetical protein
MVSLKKLLLIIVALVSLTSCASDVANRKYEVVNFADRSPSFKFSANEIDIVDNFSPTFRAPYIEHIFPIPPAQALVSWAKQRIILNNQNNRKVRFIINNASVKETRLPKEEGVIAGITNKQNTKYELVMDALIEVSAKDNTDRAEMEVNIARSITTDSSISIVEKEKLFYSLMVDAIEDFDKKVSENILHFLGTYCYQD